MVCVCVCVCNATTVVEVREGSLHRFTPLGGQCMYMSVSVVVLYARLGTFVVVAVLGIGENMYLDHPWIFSPPTHNVSFKSVRVSLI